MYECADNYSKYMSFEDVNEIELIDYTVELDLISFGDMNRIELIYNRSSESSGCTAIHGEQVCYWCGLTRKY
jgi:hypothetical protein